MFKKLLLIFSFLALPVLAGSYEDALSKNDNVFLYFYTPECMTCQKFNSTYDNLNKNTSGFSFVKVNANTPYGYKLMKKFNGKYLVPYIIMTNSKTKKSVNIQHSCVMDEICLIRAMKSFKG